MATFDDRSVQQWVDARMSELTPEPDWRIDASRRRNELLARLDATLAKSVSRSRTLGRTSVVAVLVLVVLVGLTPVGRAFADKCGDLLHAALGHDEPSRAYVSPSNRAALGHIQLTDVSGATLPLARFSGKVVLLQFWSADCRRCQTETQWFSEFQTKYRDVAVLAVSFPDEAASHPVPYPIGLANDELARLNQARLFPLTLMLDRQGRLAIRHTGYCTRQEYEADIRALLAETAHDFF
jgi:thiol-disulfide isomerase/thioredoxin